MELSPIRHFTGSKKFVGAILRDCPETRGDDKALLMEAWERQGLHLTEEQKIIFRKCLAAETITRDRREIQELGWYRDVQKWEQRQLLAEQVKERRGQK